jgi:hypothetical protein
VPATCHPREFSPGRRSARHQTATSPARSSPHEDDRLPLGRQVANCSHDTKEFSAAPRHGDKLPRVPLPSSRTLGAGPPSYRSSREHQWRVLAERPAMLGFRGIDRAAEDDRVRPGRTRHQQTRCHARTKKGNRHGPVETEKSSYSLTESLGIPRLVATEKSWYSKTESLGIPRTSARRDSTSPFGPPGRGWGASRSLGAGDLAGGDPTSRCWGP